MNFLQYFLVLGFHKLLDPGGTLGFVTSSYWLTAEGAAKTRDFLLANGYIDQVISFRRFSPFPNAPRQHNVIVILKKGCPPSGKKMIRLIEVEGGGKEPLPCRIVAAAHGGDRGARQIELPYNPARLVGRPWYLLDGMAAPLLDRLSRLPQLGLFFLTRQGTAPGAQKVTRKNLQLLGQAWVAEHNIKLNEGIFVLTTKEAEALQLPPLEQQFLKPFIKNSHIKPYYIAKAGLWLLYLHHEQVTADACPHILQHLRRFKPLLTRKREFKSGHREWFHLHWPRDEFIFTSEKVVTAHRGKSPAFAWSDKPLYAATDVYFILARPEVNMNLSLKALTAVLNSTLAKFWFAHRTKSKGEQREFFANALAEFPLPEKASLLAHKKEITKLEMGYPIEIKGENDEVIERYRRELVDDLVYRLYDLSEHDKQTIAAD
jgi:adenine-specific DNA-methyltransferase